MPQRFRHPADLGGDNRQAACERLSDDHPVRLPARREHEQISRAVAAGKIDAGLWSRELHAAVQPAVEDAPAQTFGELGVALHAADAQALPTQAAHHRERVEQQVVPLAGDDCSDREQRPGRRRAGREVGGIGAGLGDVDAVARQRVELQERAPSPDARRDDRRRGRQHRALPLLHACVRCAVAERHVHEHDQAQAARLWGEHLGRR